MPNAPERNDIGSTITLTTAATASAERISAAAARPRPAKETAPKASTSEERERPFGEVGVEEQHAERDHRQRLEHDDQQVRGEDA